MYVPNSLIHDCTMRICVSVRYWSLERGFRKPPPALTRLLWINFLDLPALKQLKIEDIKQVEALNVTSAQSTKDNGVSYFHANQISLTAFSLYRFCRRYWRIYFTTDRSKPTNASWFSSIKEADMSSVHYINTFLHHTCHVNLHLCNQYEAQTGLWTI